MNESEVIKLLVGALGALIAWLWHSNDKKHDKHQAASDKAHAAMWKAIDDQRERVSSLELKVAGEVATKDDADKLQRRLDDMAHELGVIGKTMARIEERLRMPPE